MSGKFGWAAALAAICATCAHANPTFKVESTNIYSLSGIYAVISFSIIIVVIILCFFNLTTLFLKLKKFSQHYTICKDQQKPLPRIGNTELQTC